jgi:hypothetical protein
LRETFFSAESGDLILVRLRLTAKRKNVLPFAPLHLCVRHWFTPPLSVPFAPLHQTQERILVRLRLTAKRIGHPTARCYRNPVPLFAFFFASLRLCVRPSSLRETVDLMLVRLRLTAKRNGHPTARLDRNPIPLFAFFFAPLHLCVRQSSLLRVAI